ncbi:TrmB family transcriptional regulator [Macrococcoides canis]|uniref:TrmB family transcriptional regulator n=1 Tax=Macrococcoides canis TaxID=1855823 RepID=UPI001AEC66B8|nr:TrmB family transcriptional regulator [Macrococcus canis]QTQ07431.1 TrmB family transcriptional regulator [Macrococcus canis]
MTQEIYDQLMSVGLTKYEAKTYVAALKNGKSTAYKISKTSAVPRSRIYDILNKLEERQLIYSSTEDEQIYYTAKPYRKFLQDTKQDMEQTLDTLEREFKQLNVMTAEDLIIKSYQQKDEIINQMLDVIHNAKNTVYISVWPATFDLIKDALKDVAVRGILFNHKSPYKTLIEHRTTSYTQKVDEHQWFIIINDQDEMIYGSDISIKCQAYYSTDLQQIYLNKNFIWHDILVNELVRKSDSMIDEWIAQERNAFFS